MDESEAMIISNPVLTVFCPGRLARYVGPRTEQLELIAPGLKYNTGRGFQMALDVGAATAVSMSGMHCELVDKRATKPDAIIWGHNYGIVVNDHSKRFYDEGKRHLFATFEMIFHWRPGAIKTIAHISSPIIPFWSVFDLVGCTKRQTKNQRRQTRWKSSP